MNKQGIRALHVIPSLSSRHGGPSTALPLMERALRVAGIDVTVVTTDDDGPEGRVGVALESPVAVNGATRYYFRKQTDFYKYSRPLARWLDSHVAEFDVVHVHALFSHASVAGARAARRHGVPYVVRPLGVLSRYGMTQRRARLKRLSYRWVERPLLGGAALIHYTSQQEKVEAEELPGIPSGLVVPLGIDIDALEGPFDVGPFLSLWPIAIEKDVVLFLSRLDPKKRLELLIEAFADVKVKCPSALLVIAGEGEPEYVADLAKKVSQRGLASNVLWTGHIAGELKSACLELASVFVLSSESENFGLAAVEALAAGVPIILSRGVGISDAVESAAAGLVVDGNAAAIAEAISRVLLDRDLAGDLSANGRVLARERYSLEAMGIGLRELYERAMRRKSGAV